LNRSCPRLNTAGVTTIGKAVTSPEELGLTLDARFAAIAVAWELAELWAPTADAEGAAAWVDP
jgi:hypothetical protein